MATILTLRIKFEAVHIKWAIIVVNRNITYFSSIIPFETLHLFWNTLPLWDTQQTVTTFAHYYIGL